MTTNPLDSRLPIVNGRLKLTADSLPGDPMRPLLAEYNGNQPLVIEVDSSFGQNGKKVTAEAVEVKGKANFLHDTNVAVLARFTGDKTKADATLNFALIDGEPGPTPWRFSKSFPVLPVFPSEKGRGGEPTKPFLDTLTFADAAFVLTSLDAGAEAPAEAELVRGLNFTARFEPGGILGLLETLVGGDLGAMSGTIAIPGPTGSTPPLPRRTNPWQVADRAVPGILLAIDLGIDHTFESTKLRFYDTKLHIYTPPDQDWAAANPSYVAQMAVSGKIDIPSAGLTGEEAVEVTVRRVGPRGLRFDASLDFGLENLEMLLDAANGSDLAGSLPPKVRDKLGSSSLRLKAFGLGFRDGLIPNLAYLTVAIDHIDSDVLGAFKLERIYADFAVGEPFGPSRALSVTVGGIIDVPPENGARFDVSAEVTVGSGETDVVARAVLQETAELKLGRLLGKFTGLPAASEVPDLAINSMDLTIAPGKGFSFGAVLASDPPWKLEVGPQPITIEDVQLTVVKPAEGKTQGSFAGTVAIGESLVFNLGYDLPGDFYLRADLPELKLSELIEHFDGIRGTGRPPAFDFTLDQSYVLIEKRQQNLTFSVATDVAGFGLLAFTAAKSSAGWGFAFGLDIDAKGLKNVPVVGGVIGGFADLVGLDEVVMVLSSLADPGFTFPSFSKFEAPKLPPGPIKPPGMSSGVIKGLNFFASFKETKSRGLTKLLEVLGLAELDLEVVVQISLPDPMTDSKLYLKVGGRTDLQGSINDQTTFRVELGVGVRGQEEFYVFLEGDVDTNINGQKASFSASVLVQENGILLQGSYTGAPLDFGLFKLSQLALVFGFDWEGIPSLGFAAQIDTKSFDSSLAVFLNSEIPTQSLLAGAVSDLSLKDVLDTFTAGAIAHFDGFLDQVAIQGTHHFQIPADDKIVAALDNHDKRCNKDLATIAAAFAKNGEKPWATIPADASGVLLVVNEEGKRWSLTDKQHEMRHFELRRNGKNIDVALEAQVYLAPQATWLGKIKYPQGFFLSGALEVFGFHAAMTIVVDTEEGIAVQAAADELVIVNKWLFSLRAATDILEKLADESRGAQQSEVSKQIQKSWEIRKAAGVTGPIIDVSTFKQPDNPIEQFREPHLYVNGELEILGIKNALFAYVGKPDGKSSYRFLFKFVHEDPVMRFKLTGYFGKLNDLSLKGEVHVGLELLHIDTGLVGKVSITVDGSNIDAYCTAGFELLGREYEIERLELEIDTNSLEKLPKALEKAALGLLLNPIKCAMTLATVLM